MDLTTVQYEKRDAIAHVTLDRPDQLLAEAEKVASRLAEFSPMAVQGMKESMVRASSLDYKDLDRITEAVQNRVMNSEDRKEGGRAFVERRPARWPSRCADKMISCAFA